MPTAPRMNKPQGGYDFWADTLQPGLFGLYDRWTEQKPWPTPAQIDAAVQNPGLLDRDVMAGYAVDMAQPFAAKLGGLLAHGAMPPGGLFGITSKLPMDEASRMARARGMGGDLDENWYHGTSTDVADLQPLGTSTKSQAAKEATFLINNPDVAAEYAELAAEKVGGNPNVMPIIPLPGSSKVAVVDWAADFGGVPMRSNNGQRLLGGLLKDAKEQGFDMIRINNADDAVTDGQNNSVLAILNQTKRRGKFAEFNPLADGATDLLASLAGVGLLGGLAFSGQPSEDF